MSAPTIPHGILAGDLVTVGRGTKLWYVEAAYAHEVTVSHNAPRGGPHWTPRGPFQPYVEMRRHLRTPEQIATLRKATP